MLPANMRGVQYSRNSLARQTFSSPIRNNGRASRHSDPPALRYRTATVAFRLSSPLIFHSNPRLISVAGSTMKSPEVTALLLCWEPGVYEDDSQKIVRMVSIRNIFNSPGRKLLQVISSIEDEGRRITK